MNDDKKEIEVEIEDEVWTLQAGNAAAQEFLERMEQEREGKK